MLYCDRVYVAANRNDGLVLVAFDLTEPRRELSERDENRARYVAERAHELVRLPYIEKEPARPPVTASASSDDPEADRGFLAGLQAKLKSAGAGHVKIEEFDLHINDNAFAAALADRMDTLVRGSAK